MYLFCFQRCFYQNLSNKLLLGGPWHAIWNRKSESVIQHQEEKKVLGFNLYELFSLWLSDITWRHRTVSLLV